MVNGFSIGLSNEICCLASESRPTRSEPATIVDMCTI